MVPGTLIYRDSCSFFPFQRNVGCFDCPKHSFLKPLNANRIQSCTKEAGPNWPHLFCKSRSRQVYENSRVESFLKPLNASRIQSSKKEVGPNWPHLFCKSRSRQVYENSRVEKLRRSLSYWGGNSLFPLRGIELKGGESLGWKRKCTVSRKEEELVLGIHGTAQK